MPDEAPDELAARRRELEMEHDQKMRDLRMQERRLKERLAQDREDWERYRREQAQELADRTETLKRQQESARKQTELKAKERVELQEAKREVDDDRAAREAEAAELGQRVEQAEARLARAKSRWAWTAGILALAGAAWLLSAWREGGPALTLWAAGAATAYGLLAALRATRS